jgi:hypothetical protein
MLSDVINWNTTMMVIVSVLSIHAGIKLINKLFDKTNKKKNSLF